MIEVGSVHEQEYKHAQWLHLSMTRSDLADPKRSIVTTISRVLL